MKRGAWKHPKITALSIDMGVPKIMAVGIIESLIHWTSEYCVTGAIGRYSNLTIAREIGYDGDGDKLVAALITSGWVDECADAQIRLFVHDWSVHCEDSVHARVWSSGAQFADGGKIRKRAIPPELRGKRKPRQKPGDTHQLPGEPHGCLGGALAKPSQAKAPAIALAEPVPLAVTATPARPPIPEPEPEDLRGDVSARLARLGMNPETARELADAGCTLAEAAQVLGENSKPGNGARNPMDATVGTLRQRYGIKKLSKAGTIGRELEKQAPGFLAANSELLKRRARLGSG